MQSAVLYSSAPHTVDCRLRIGRDAGRNTLTRFKLLAADVDGTLVGPDQQVSPRNRRAVEAAKRAGLTVCLATGRGVKEVVGVRQACGLDGHADPLVCISGALICEGHSTRTLHIEPIDLDTAGAGCEAIGQFGLSAVALVDPWRWGYDYILMASDDVQHIRDKWLDRDDFGIRSARSLADLDDRPEILRLTAIADRPLADQVEAALNQACGGRLRVEQIFAPNYGIHVVECFARDINKWTGIRYVAQGLRVRSSDIAAIGDDINDLPLFTHVGLAAAMGNAAEPIRAAADHTTAGHDADGFALFVEKLLDGEFD